MQIRCVRRNERKLQVLEAFATNAAMRPVQLAPEVGIYPFRRAYTYLLRLHRWGYLQRRRDHKGRIVYRLSPRGARYLLWHRRKAHVAQGISAPAARRDHAQHDSTQSRSGTEQPLRIERQNTIIGIAGRKGSGKSTQARKILEQCPRLFLFDSVGEHAWVAERFERLDEAIMCLLETPYRDEFSASLTPTSDDVEADFAECCDEIYDAGNMLFAIEELPMLATAHHIPKKLNRIVRLGRHQNISILYTAQRLAECPRSVTSATDILVLFCHSEPRDLNAIAERCGSAVAERVRGLGTHEFVVWDTLTRQLVRAENDWYRGICGCHPMRRG